MGSRAAIPSRLYSLRRPSIGPERIVSRKRCGVVKSAIVSKRAELIARRGELGPAVGTFAKPLP